jgi:hypothetical protein
MKTVRQFLTENLTESEMQEVSMMPQLMNTYSYSTTPSTNQNTRNTIRLPYCFQLRFIRKNCLEKNELASDTVVTIFKNNNSTYDLQFKEDITKNKTSGLTRSQILKYLSVHLRSVATDDDPFDCVQFLPPNAPSVLYSMEKIDYSDVRDLIYDSLEISMDTWPSTM